MRKVLAALVIVAGLSAGCAPPLPRPTESAERSPANFVAQRYQEGVGTRNDITHGHKNERITLSLKYACQHVPESSGDIYFDSCVSNPASARSAGSGLAASCESSCSTMGASW